MNVLFWTPPWPVNGNPDFFRNAVRKHLVPQANCLSPFIDHIDFVLPEYLASEAKNLNARVRTITLPFEFVPSLRFQSSVAYESLYRSNEPQFEENIAIRLKHYLAEHYDAILLWENPAPFLRNLFQTAVIVHQMPGVFSRPPYPHTVVFDPIGLYRSSALHIHAMEIQRGAIVDQAASDVADTFCSELRRCISLLQPLDTARHIFSGAWQRRELLPLQTSGHYAFRCDTRYENQLEFLLDVLSSTDPDTAVITTQYVTPHVKDTTLNQEIAEFVKRRFPNFLYDHDLERVDSVSQFILPLVEGVVCASSSLGLQAMAYRKTLRVQGQTFLANYDTSIKALDDLSWGERCHNTVATMLMRHQPLASAVTQDGEFLSNALEDLISRKRAGKEGLDLLPHFERIDPNYSRRLLDGFRIGQTAKKLGVRNPEWNAKHRVLQTLQKMIDTPETKAVSFDVFDTLICRPVEKPADLFKFLDCEALRITGGVAADFGRIRTMCEVETRNRLANSKDEITLDDIYDTISAYYDLSEEQAEAVKRAEIELEVASVQERPFGRKLYALAREFGFPIYLISDMYLPKRVVEAMLHKAGYHDYAELFVSAEYGCRKHSGHLYKLVLERLAIPARSLVHVGDNKRTDIEAAEAQGIRAFRWSSAIEWMRCNPIFERIYPPRVGAGEKARSAIAGVSALGLFDAPVSSESGSSLSGGLAERLGYAVLGPIVTAYMTWLGREARRDGITDIYFLAREGWVLKEAFNVLHHGDDALPEGKYLYASRRAVRVAACRTRGDVMALASLPYTPGIGVDRLVQGRFGIELTPERTEMLASHGVTHLSRPLERSFADHQTWMTVCKVLVDDILRNAEAERAAYESYLVQNGFYATANPAVVDIGWKGNIQGALSALANRCLTGYYYATVQDSEIWLNGGNRHRCFIGQALSSQSSYSSVAQNRPLIEFMLCHSEPSLVNMRKLGISIKPIFRPEHDHVSRRLLIDALHRGALEFVRNFRRGFGHLANQIYIDPALAEKAFREFTEAPTPLDARVLMNQCFEDAVGGVQKKFVVSPDPANYLQDSIWKRGAEAVHRRSDRAKQSCDRPVSPTREPARRGVGVTTEPARTESFICDNPAQPATGFRKEPVNSASSVFNDPVNSVPLSRSTTQEPVGAMRQEKRALERAIIKKMLSRRKYDKYLRSRDVFFNDSRSPLVRLYYRIAEKVV